MKAINSASKGVFTPAVVPIQQLNRYNCCVLFSGPFVFTLHDSKAVQRFALWNSAIATALTTPHQLISNNGNNEPRADLQ